MCSGGAAWVLLVRRLVLVLTKHVVCGAIFPHRQLQLSVTG